MDEYLLSGSILCGEEFDLVEGYISIRDGAIAEICEDTGSVDAIAHGIILPSFVNAHTHLILCSRIRRSRISPVWYALRMG